MTRTNAEKNRIANALRGVFAGDALAMPVHWYYDRENITREFNGGITDYEAPRHPHPESFMVGMSYGPDVERATALGRPYDILHEHARFYETTYSTLEIERGEREGQHGNAVPSLDERYHYHHGLRRGENTLGAHLVRVLLRSIAAEGRYRPQAFLEHFVHHLATAGENRDPYTEIYIRRWFENYSRGVPAHAAAELQRNVWSIGSHGGMIRPMALSLLAGTNAFESVGIALEHQALTHRSENVASAVTVAVPLLHELVCGENPRETVVRHARSVHLPVITGREMFREYRESNGPGNIPDERMWQIHTQLRDEPFDVAAMATEVPEQEAVMGVFATACYPEHGFPLSLYHAVHHDFSLIDSLRANANAGGDNVHRGMVLGLIVGAASDQFPQALWDGLAERDAIEREIDSVLKLL